MKRLFEIVVLALIIVAFTNVRAQDSGVIWIKTFEPGSSSLADISIESDALAQLDELMQNDNIEVTFLGAADGLGWRMNGERVHAEISEAWNDAKRLSRARTLRARYGRGKIGITHESIAGVKVVWSQRSELNPYTDRFDGIEETNTKLATEFAQLKSDFENMQNQIAANTLAASSQRYSKFNWRLQAGMWAWKSSSRGALFSPSLGLNIIIDKTAFVIQAGVTPWHTTSQFGNLAESHVYTGVKHMKTARFGLTVGVFRGWEFFTATDDWSFKTTGMAGGFVLKQSIFEFNPALTYSHSNNLTGDSKWRLGASIGFNININEAF